MSNVTYAVNERFRRVLRYVLVGGFILAILSPFFIFSNFGANKIHDWAIRNNSPGLLYASARIHCIMGGLSDERYVPAQDYFEEYVQRYSDHKNIGYGYFYLAWSIENQKRDDRQQRRDDARDAYEEFVGRFPDHAKRENAERALNRIEVDSGR